MSKETRSGKGWHALIWVLIDTALLCASLYLAQVVRYSTDLTDTNYLQSLRLAPAMIVISLLVFLFFSIYHTLWQYASANDLIRLTMATLLAALLTYLFSLTANLFVKSGENLFRLHRFVYLLHWLFSTALIGLSRLIYRMALTRERVSFLRRSESPRRVMIIGAGWAGANLVHEMQSGSFGNCIPAVVVDDDRDRTGRQLSGVPVEKGSSNIIKLASDYRIDEIVIAIATPNDDLKMMVEKCLATGCRVRRFNPLQEVRSGASINTLVRDIDINDLLGRPEKQMDMEAVRRYFSGKRILITGGGGSIGSELCRRLLTCSPEKIILYDMSENYMYDLFNEMKLLYGNALNGKLLLCVGSVRDENRLDEVFSEYMPQIVLHAAAHKHVPLMEDCPDQAVKNNVFGTQLVAKTSVKYGVERFVMISTDKALNPTNVMGATKLLAEQVVQAMNGTSATEFIAVRFGNVLGSHGSVVPLFERQIRAGGPVTLTDPDIIRYFMTIPEAASLVLQAATMAKGGELFILDMGRPVKIRELAERMIQLYAPRDGRKVEIVYTGLRPGEKLYEELLVAEEGVVRTENEKIFVSRTEFASPADVEEKLAQLRKCLDENGDMLACLHRLLPSFKTPEEVNGKVEGRQA